MIFIQIMETIGDYFLAFIIIVILITLSYVVLGDNFNSKKTSINLERKIGDNINNQREIGDHLRFLKFRNVSPPKNINPKILNFKKAETLKFDKDNFNERKFRESLYEENYYNQYNNNNEANQILNNGNN